MIPGKPVSTRIIKSDLGVTLWLTLIPFPITAKKGQTNKNKTIIPPNKFPTNICGIPSIIALIPIENSGAEVIIPSNTKEMANEDNWILLASLVTFRTTESDVNQIKINAKMILANDHNI